MVSHRREPTSLSTAWRTGTAESDAYRNWLRTLEVHQLKNLIQNFSDFPNSFTKTREEWQHKRWCILMEMDRRKLM
jgi:hypothetical protein